MGPQNNYVRDATKNMCENLRNGNECMSRKTFFAFCFMSLRQ